MAAPQFKAVHIATPQMRSESGLIFRSKQSVVWPADPRGRRGGCEPAGKTCYLPRFHIMHRSAVLPVEERCPRCEDARKQTDPCADFVCLELPRGRTLGQNQYVELEIKKAKVNGRAFRLLNWFPMFATPLNLSTLARRYLASRRWKKWCSNPSVMKGSP